MTPEEETKALSLLGDLNQLIEQGITHFETIGDNMETEAPNFARGAGIVMQLAWLEGSYTKEEWNEKKNPPTSWKYAEEFRNFYQMRHCFAHFGDGTFFETKRAGIESFLQKLESGEITDEDEQGRITVRTPYYRIENDTIVLDCNATRRCRMICFRFRKEFS